MHELKGKREELKQATEQLKTFKVGTSEYAAQWKSKLHRWSRSCDSTWTRKRKELADAEAKIYFENYKLIANGVKFLAQHYKINLVLALQQRRHGLGKR